MKRIKKAAWTTQMKFVNGDSWKATVEKFKVVDEEGQVDYEYELTRQNYNESGILTQEIKRIFPTLIKAKNAIKINAIGVKIVWKRVELRRGLFR